MLYERACPCRPSLLHRLSHRAPAGCGSTAPAGAATRATRCWARPTTSWCTTPAMAARPTASACARAVPWWPPPAEPGRVVTNGMSQYSRNERNANAGDGGRHHADDYPTDPVAFEATLGTTHGAEAPTQASTTRWPVSCCSASWNRAPMLGGSDYSAPGQLVGDFTRANLAPMGRCGAFVPARRAAGRPARRPARLCHRGLARGIAGVRPARSRALTCTTRC